MNCCDTMGFLDPSPPLSFGVIGSDHPNDDPSYVEVANGNGVLIDEFGVCYTGTGGEWICVCTETEWNDLGLTEASFPVAGPTNCFDSMCGEMCPTPSPM